MKYKPTKEDCAIIRNCAKRSAGCARVELRLGKRYNTDKGDHDIQSNIALLSDDPHWEDTDLWDHTEWKYFKRGVTMTDDGRGIFDFYVYGPVGAHDCELQTNVVAYYEGNKLVRVTDTGDVVMWES